MTTRVNCPTCQKSVQWSEENKYRPFCSKRCQLIDLGEWASESNTISTPLAHGDKPGFDAEMIEDIEAMLAKNDDDFFKQ